MSNARPITEVSREQFLAFMNSPEFPAVNYAQIKGQTREGVMTQKTHRIGEYRLYATKKVSEKKLDMFLGSDTTKLGFTNLNNSKVPKDKVMVLTAIVLLFATTANGTDDEVLGADFRPANNKPQVMNGEFTFGIKQKNRILDKQATTLFNDPDRPGILLLGSPVLITEQVEFECTVELATMTGIDSNKDFIKLELLGSWNRPE